MKARRVFYFGKFIAIGIAFLALFTYVVMLLWNWLVPELFSGPSINLLANTWVAGPLKDPVLGHRWGT